MTAPITARDTAAESSSDASRQWWILAVVGLAQLIVVLDATVVNIALPSAQADLGFSNDARQWIITAYALAFGSLLLLGGRVADLFGRKTALVIGLVGFGVASMLGGLSVNVGMLIGARALQGLFGALLAPAALSTLTTTFVKQDERDRAFAIYGTIASAGGVVGLLLGGLLTEYLDWRWTRFVSLGAAAVALVGALTFLPNKRAEHRAELDIPGALLVSAGLFAIVFGLSRAASRGWSSPQSWVSLIVGGLLLVAFVWSQTRAAHPLLPLRVVTERNRGASFLAVFITGAGIFGVFLFLTYYLRLTLHYSPVRTGLAFLPMIGALMVAARLATITLLPKIGPRPIVPTGMALAAFGLVWLTRLDPHSSFSLHVLPPTLILGVGMGLIFAPGMAIATYGVRPNDAGVASAMVNTSQQVGGSIGVALLSTLSASAATNYAKGKVPSPAVTAQAQLHSYSTAYWWAAAFFALGFLLCTALYRSGAPKSDPDAQTPDAQTAVPV